MYVLFNLTIWALLIETQAKEYIDCYFLTYSMFVVNVSPVGFFKLALQQRQKLQLVCCVTKRCICCYWAESGTLPSTLVAPFHSLYFSFCLKLLYVFSFLCLKWQRKYTWTIISPSRLQQSSRTLAILS